AYCSVRIIFMGVGVAKIHEKPIPKELRDMSFIVCDDLRADLLIRTNHIPVLFGVEVGGELCGIDQVTEHDGELPTFGFWYARLGGERFNLGRWLCLGGRRLGCLGRWRG